MGLLVTMLVPAMYAQPALAGEGPATALACERSGSGGLALTLSRTPEAVSGERCTPADLPVPIDSVRWAGWLSGPGPRVQDGLTITGGGSGATFTPQGVGVHARDPGTPGAEPLPIDADLTPGLLARPFGIEERASVSRTDREVTLSCRPGSKPAGIALDPGSRRFPKGARLSLRVGAIGDEGFTAAIAARGGSPRLEAPLDVRHPTQLAPPDDPLARAAPALVLACPETGGIVSLSDVRLVPASPFPPPASRSAWAWKPSLWRDDGSALIERAKALNLSRLFVTVEVVEEAVPGEDRLQAFVAAARGAGISVVAVEGDPGMALAEGRSVAVRRLRAIAAYQRRAPEPSRLAGVQYDIEPYLLPLYAENPERVLSGWAETLDALARTAPGVGLDMVLPFWLAEGEAARRIVLPAVRRVAERVTIMAYRTRDAEILAVAEGLLAWGAEAGLSVHVGLEAGPVEDETTRIYGAAATGDLLLVPQAGGRTLALLLHEPRSGPQGRIFAFERETVAAASQVSFLGDEAHMLTAATRLAPALAAWPSLAGFAFHGALE